LHHPKGWLIKILLSVFMSAHCGNIGAFVQVINEPLRARSSRRLRLRVLRDLRGFKEKQQMDEDTYSLKKNKNRNRIMSAVLLIFITPPATQST